MAKKISLRSIMIFVLIGFFTVSVSNFDAWAYAENNSGNFYESNTGSILIEQSNYIKPKYIHEPTHLQVSGTIENYQRAEATTLTLTTPSGDIIENIIRPTREGEFDFLSLITNNDSVGFYEIHIIHKNIVTGPATYKIIEEKKNQSTVQTTVPEWVKNNAGWWAQGLIGNNDFVEGIQYLINESVIDVPPRSSGPETGSNEIPEWVKNNAGWWAQGQIETHDFLRGIEFLVEQGIIKIV